MSRPEQGLALPMDHTHEPATSHPPVPDAGREPSPPAGASERRPAASPGRSHRVRLEGLDAHYGDHQAVRGVSMAFEPGAVTAIIGPSGCGKSTMVRCVNRMHEEVPGARSEGRVLLGDVDLHAPEVDVVAVRRAVGMVFQKPNPFPTMSIFDNVAAGLRFTGAARSEVDDRVHGALRGAGLWEEVKDRLGRPGTSLSGGQQQRLCIARALAVDPQVLLLDEPCSALDPRSTQVIEELMVSLADELAVVIVTHNMQQAARVADMTAFFSVDVSQGDRRGILVEYDSTAKIFTQPGDQRTEDYVTGRFG